ncbi:hypothetical protein [Streptomyces sp. McG3]|uniref:hypothetical protein n=1 Tax=unclassified Streptomyces TaxID=2593676 RepID=UPI001BE5E61A|nr:hypothetical protein [Streptomyces sp. McG3]MBT2896308.1 hypothetical protein [Streptomyces sp. McG3]
MYAGGQPATAPGITGDETDTTRITYVTASGTDRVFAATRAAGGARTARSAAPVRERGPARGAT